MNPKKKKKRELNFVKLICRKTNFSLARLQFFRFFKLVLKEGNKKIS